MTAVLNRLESNRSAVRVAADDLTNECPVAPTYSLNNVCADSPVWYTWDARARIAIFAIFLVAYVAILVQWLVVRWQSKKAKQVLYGTFGTANVLMIIYLMLAIIGDSLYNCLQIDSLSYVTIFVAVDIIQSLANFFLILIMILPLTLTLLRHNYLRVTIPKIVNSIFLGVLAIVGFLSVALVSAENMSLQNTGEDEFPNYLVPFTATYAGLYLAGAIMATGYVLVSLHTMLKYPTEFSGHLKGTMPALAASILAFALVDLIEVFAYDIAKNKWTKEIEITFLVLNLFFQFTTYELVLIVAGDKSFIVDDDLTGRTELIEDGRSEVMVETHF